MKKFVGPGCLLSLVATCGFAFADKPAADTPPEVPGAPSAAPPPATSSSPLPAHVELPEESSTEAAPRDGATTKPPKAPAASPNTAPTPGGAPSGMPYGAVRPGFGPDGYYGSGAPSSARGGEPVADARPHEPLGPLASHIDVAVNLDTIWYTRKSFDLFSDHDNATTPGVSVGYTIRFDERAALVPEIGWGTSSQSASGLFGGSIASTELSAQRVYGGASFRYGILSVLDAHARVAGGASFLHAKVEPGGSDPALEDSGTSPFVSVGGGITLHSPAGFFETDGGGLRSVVAGLTVEGGYELGGSVDITPTPTGDTGRIATKYMTFGTLERSGPYVRTSLVVRF